MTRREMSRSLCGSNSKCSRARTRGARLIIPLCALIAWDTAAACAAPPVNRLRSSAAEDAIRQSLDMPTPENFEFIEQPFTAMVEFLEDYYKINVEVDDKKLEEVGVSKDSPFTRSLPNLPVKDALGLILDDLELDYRITNGVLLITTRAAAERARELRVYDVREITRGAEGVKSLVCVIKDALADDRELKIVPFENFLVIRDHQRGHEEIEALLCTLKTAMCRPETESPQPPEQSGDEPAAAPDSGNAPAP